MNRSKLLLCILLCCLVAAVFYAVMRTPRQKIVSQLTYPPHRVTAPPGFRGNSSNRQTAADYLPPPLSEVTVKRDLFAPLRPAAASSGSKRTQNAAVSPAPPLTPPPTPPTAQELAQQQLRSFKLLGTLSRPNLQAAFLAQGTDIQVVRVGDNLLGSYRISAITPDSVVAQAVDGTDTITLQLK